MNEPARKIATYNDLYRVPDNMVGEIIDGELIVSPRPSRRHGHAAYSLGKGISPYHFEGDNTGNWIFLPEPEISFGEHTIVPDLAGWKKERFPFEEDQNSISVVPDWVCEIISPSSAGIDRVRKMGIYGDHQVPYYWIIDPIGKTLEVLKNKDGKWSIICTYSNDDRVRAEPFQEVEIYLSGLWFENP